MDLKKLKIIPPEGMEWYQEGNEIKFRPIKEKASYEDISCQLFYNRTAWYINNWSNICQLTARGCYYQPNNCTSKKQAEKLLAINQLMNVAKYLNNGWQPNWNDSDEFKYYFNIVSGKVLIPRTVVNHYSIVYFKSEKLAQQAIEILGEEIIKLAFSTDW